MAEDNSEILSRSLALLNSSVTECETFLVNWREESKDVAGVFPQFAELTVELKRELDCAVKVTKSYADFHTACGTAHDLLRVSKQLSRFLDGPATFVKMGRELAQLASRVQQLMERERPPKQEHDAELFDQLTDEQIVILQGWLADGVKR